MKLEPVEPKWMYPEMKEVFDKIAALRDGVWDQCRMELGDDMPEFDATATAIASRRIVRDDRRRAEIIEAYRIIASGYEQKMADMVIRYTVPQMIVKRD